MNRVTNEPPFDDPLREPEEPFMPQVPASDEANFQTDKAFEAKPLDPRIKRVWALANIFWTLALVASCFIGDFVWLQEKDRWELPLGTLAGLASLLFIPSLLHPPRFYKSWGYALRENDILLTHGVLWLIEQSVPRQRIQHVDIQAGPFDRIFGLCHITLYTAGTGDADAKIPGLTWQEAQQIRETLLGSS